MVGRSCCGTTAPARGRNRVFLGHMDGTPPVPLGPGAPAALSPDGKWAAVIGNGVTNERIRNKLTLFPTGAGTARTIDLPIDLEPLPWRRARPHGLVPAHVRLLCGRDASADSVRPARRSPAAVYVYDLPRNSMKPITPEGITGPAVLSPDGRFVAVNDNSQVRVYSVDDGERSTAAGRAGIRQRRRVELGWPIAVHHRTGRGPGPRVPSRCRLRDARARAGDSAAGVRGRDAHSTSWSHAMASRTRTRSRSGWRTSSSSRACDSAVKEICNEAPDCSQE